MLASTRQGWEKQAGREPVPSVLCVSRLVPTITVPSAIAQARPKMSLVWSPCSVATAWIPVILTGRNHSSLSPGHCNNFLEAVIMASDAHQPGVKVRALECSKQRNDGTDGVAQLKKVRHSSGAELKRR